MKMQLFFEMLTAMPLDRQQDASILLKLWGQKACGLFPNRVGQYEPLRQELSIDSIQDVFPLWDFGVFFKRTTAPKLDASVFMHCGPRRLHSNWVINVQRGELAHLYCLRDLLHSSAVEFSADFGFAHTPAGNDIELGSGSKTMSYHGIARKNLGMFMTTHELIKYIPDIYWVTLFGKPYVNFLSRDRLLSAPVFRVHELPNGSIILQLSELPPKFGDDDQAYNELKNRVKVHLNENAFFNLNRGRDYCYDVPIFRFLNPLH